MSDYSVSIALKAIDEASGPVKAVEGALDGLKSKLSSVADTIMSGFGMGIGMDFGQRFSEAIQGAATAGFNFNKTMEDTKTGIAAVIMANMDFVSSGGGVVTSQDKIRISMEMAAGVQEKLKVDAMNTAASYQELAAAFNSALAPALKAGITNMDEVRKITVAATQAMSALGIPTDQAAQEIRAMFQGELGPDNRLNNMLQVTKEDLLKVKGNAEATAQLFKDKLQPYTDMAAEASKNFTTRLSNLGDAFDQTMGAATKPIFDAFKTAVTNLTGDVGGFQTKLSEIGEKIGGLVSEVAPYIPKLVDFGVALLGAGVDFLTSLTPVLPILGEVLDVLTGIIEAVGPLGIGVFAAGQAISGLASGATAAVAGATALSTWIGTVGIAALGAYAVAIGVAVAALYALKLASDLSKENTAAEKSYTGMADTMVSNLGRIEKAHPELSKEVDKLKNSIVSAQREGGGAVEREAGVFQQKFNEIAAAARFSTEPINKVATAITAVAKAPVLDPKAAKAVKDLGEEHDKVLAKIRAHIDYVGGDGAKNAYAKMGADARFEIGELGKKWGTESDIVLARQEQLRVDLKAKYEEISKNLKPIPVEVSGSWFTELDKIMTKNEDLSAEMWAQGNTQISYAMGPPKAAWDTWLEKDGLITAQNKILTSDVGQEAINQGLLVLKAPTAAWASWVDNVAKSNTEIKKINENLATESGFQSGYAVKAPTDMLNIWDTNTPLVKTAMETLTGDLKTEAEKQAGNVATVPGAMLSGWTDSTGKSYDAITGFGTDLGTEAGKQTTTAKATPEGWLAAWIDSSGKSLTTVTGFGTSMMTVVPTQLGLLNTAISTEWGKITEGIQTSFQSAGTFVTGVWGAMAGGIDQFFGDAFTGKGVDLQKTFEGIFGGIQKSFGNMVSDMVQGWLTGKNTISEGLTTLEGALHPFQGSGFGATAGNAAVGGVAGYGFGSMVGSVSGAPGWQTGAQSGGALGGAIGSIIPGVGTVIGMVVGAIIGGIIGVLVAPNTENEVAANFSEMLDKASTNAFAQAGRKVLETQQNWMVSIFELGVQGAGAKAAGLTAGGLTKLYSDSLKTFLTGSDGQGSIPWAGVKAGSGEDIQKGLQQFLQTNLPRLALQAAFGQTGYGPAGNRDAAGGQAGLNWWISWMDKDGNVFEKAKQLFNPDAAIPQLLNSLGFTGAKITELATQLTTEDPEAFKKKLENLIGLVVDIDNAVAKYAGGRTGIEAELSKRAGATTTSYFAQTAQDIADAAKAMDSLTGDEALARARQIATAANQRYEEELQAIQRIKDLAASISDSIASQREDLKVRQMDPTSKANYYQAQINALMGELGKATTEGQVQSIVQQIQKFAGNLTEMAFSGTNPNTALIEWIDQILGATDTKAQSKLSGFVDDIVSTNSVLNTVLGDLKKRFTDIDTATSDLATNSGDAADNLALVGDNANAASLALARFTAALESASESMGGGGTAINAIKKNPRLLMPQVGR